jgi:thiamine pyrophosphokinase
MPAEENIKQRHQSHSARQGGFAFQEETLTRTLIIANGRPPTHPEIARWHRPGDRLIAADGGAGHALALGLAPHLVVGDMDSLDAEERTRLKRRGCQFIEHPADKDETDLELALLQAAQGGTAEIVVLGALGGRLDQLLANVLLLAMPALRGADVRLADARQEAFIVRGGDEVTVTGERGDTVSLLPLAGQARGIYTQGLKWPLSGDALAPGQARGVSNVVVSLPVRVRLETGILLVVHQFDGRDGGNKE